jgi:hypothetical protein
MVLPLPTLVGVTGRLLWKTSVGIEVLGPEPKDKHSAVDLPGARLGQRVDP